jgi:hypothetical protein
MVKSLTLSLFELNSISRRFRRNQEGGESGSVTIMETEFPAGLARVKAKTLFRCNRVSWVRSGYSSDNRVKAFSLSGSGRVSRVRLGPGRITGLRRFPYPGAIRLAGLARVKLG